MQYNMFPRPPLEQGNLTGAIAMGWNRNTMYKGTMTGDVSVLFIADPPYPCQLYWIVTQNATGGWLVDWSGVTNLRGDTPIVSAVPLTTTVVPLFWDGTNYNV